MSNHIITTAINNRQCLSCTYDGQSRIIEPHAYGINSQNHEVIRAWQNAGGSNSNSPAETPRLWVVSKMQSLQLSNKTFTPRERYTRGDKGMSIIYAQI